MIQILSAKGCFLDYSLELFYYEIWNVCYRVSDKTLFFCHSYFSKATRMSSQRQLAILDIIQIVHRFDPMFVFLIFCGCGDALKTHVFKKCRHRAHKYANMYVSSYSELIICFHL